MVENSKGSVAVRRDGRPTWGLAARWGMVAAVVAACGGPSGNSPDGGATAVDGSASPHPQHLDGSVSDAPSIVIGGDAAGQPKTDSGTSPPTSLCDPSCVAAGGTCVAGTCTISENPGGLPPAAQPPLTTGGTADSSFGWLYPYDKTVFPRGLLPPVLQFAGTAYDAALVTVSFQGFSYTGFFSTPTGSLKANQLQLSPAVWTAITNAAQAKSAVTVSVTKSSAGKVTGPISETWSVAQGAIRGSIYYETYGSTIVGGSGGVGIMKIQPGAKQPVTVKSGCGNVCHTASADGSTLVAAVTVGATSASYDLKNSAATIFSASNSTFTYGGLYPDGTFLMSATNYRSWKAGNSQLYDTKTGAAVAATGWSVTNAGTPAFSPDGTMIAFNHGLSGGGKGGTLGVADFKNSTKTFSNITDVATASDPKNGTLAWPAFTPDTKTVVFHAGSNAAFETDKGATGDLYAVDIASKTTARLDALDGYTAAPPATTSYLPAGDPGLSFAPTILPEAVGGYYWVVFTSHRSYGNTTPSKDNGDQNGKLWVAAIDMSGTPGKDSSHPAFFLDGQELGSDNLRGFWVLDPCQTDGTSCTSGDECCGGYCRAGGDAGLVCLATLPDAGSCSQAYEKCATAADCCDPGDSCINGRCALPQPQ